MTSQGKDEQPAPWPYFTQRSAARILKVPTEFLRGLANNPIPAVKAGTSKGNSIWLFQREAVLALAAKELRQREGAEEMSSQDQGSRTEADAAAFEQQRGQGLAPAICAAPVFEVGGSKDCYCVLTLGHEPWSASFDHVCQHTLKSRRRV